MNITITLPTTNEAICQNIAEKMNTLSATKCHFSMTGDEAICNLEIPDTTPVNLIANVGCLVGQTFILEMNKQFLIRS
jgi:hypothetical protein